MLSRKNIYTGMALAVLATLIWSGNFIVARGAYRQIPPASLAFYRWLCASLVLLPFAYTAVKQEWPVIRRSGLYLFFASLTGIALFNTLVYIGGQYSPAINLALIGTTSSPIIAVILARIFLKEQISWTRLAGMLICIAGILYLLSHGDFRNLLSFRFTKGDTWVLLAGFVFAVYNTMVRRKPPGISAISYLFVIFSLGTLMLLPFHLRERAVLPPVHWNSNLVLIILYLGIGASVISFLAWNRAIACLGAGRTALFGNLIPVFSALEAVLILGERISRVHLISFHLVVLGLLVANYSKSK